MTDPAVTFSKAITRRPSSSVIDGLRSHDAGNPDFAQLEKDHKAYVKSLKAAGAEVLELDPLEDLADAVFVEDTALCLPDCAVLMRTGAKSRQPEVLVISFLSIAYQSAFLTSILSKGAALRS